MGCVEGLTEEVRVFVVVEIWDADDDCCARSTSS